MYSTEISGSFTSIPQQCIKRALVLYKGGGSPVSGLAFVEGVAGLQECARGAIRGFVTYFDDGKRNAKQFRDDMIRVLQVSPPGNRVLVVFCF